MLPNINEKISFLKLCFSKSNIDELLEWYNYDSRYAPAITNMIDFLIDYYLDVESEISFNFGKIGSNYAALFRIQSTKMYIWFYGNNTYEVYCPGVLSYQKKIEEYISGELSDLL